MKLSYEQALEVKGANGLMLRDAVSSVLYARFMKGRRKQVLVYIGLLVIGVGGLLLLTKEIALALYTNALVPLHLDQTLGFAVAVMLVAGLISTLMLSLAAIYLGYRGLTEFSRQCQLYLGRAFKEEVEL